jgi:hypothetical protein
MSYELEIFLKFLGWMIPAIALWGFLDWIGRRERAKDEKVFVYECFGETILFAESLGFVEDEPEPERPPRVFPYDGWSASMADGLEEDALDFIESKGFRIIQEEGPPCS